MVERWLGVEGTTGGLVGAPKFPMCVCELKYAWNVFPFIIASTADSPSFILLEFMIT
jgi:hypothetical protein